MFKKLSAAAFVLASFAIVSPVKAGVYTDDLSKCLVSSSSATDQTDLVRWIFSAIALHPDIRAMANISPEQRAEIDKKVGALFTRLLTSDCRTQTVAALKYEGSTSLETSFGVLGQIATRGLFSAPEVKDGMGGLTKNIDVDKISALTKEAGLTAK